MKQSMKVNWRFVWGIIMVLFYLGMAVLLFFSDFFDIREGFKIVISILFFAYGLFRGYRIWKNYL